MNPTKPMNCAFAIKFLEYQIESAFVQLRQNVGNVLQGLCFSYLARRALTSLETKNQTIPIVRRT